MISTILSLRWCRCERQKKNSGVFLENDRKIFCRSHMHHRMTLCDDPKNVLRVCYFNPLTLRAAKRGLPILEIFQLQNHFLKNI